MFYWLSESFVILQSCILEAGAKTETGIAIQKQRHSNVLFIFSNFTQQLFSWVFSEEKIKKQNSEHFFKSLDLCQICEAPRFHFRSDSMISLFSWKTPAAGLPTIFWWLCFFFAPDSWNILPKICFYWCHLGFRNHFLPQRQVKFFNSELK